MIVRKTIGLLAALGLCGAVLAGFTAFAATGDKAHPAKEAAAGEKHDFGDWRMICDAPAQGGNCRIVQYYAVSEAGAKGKDKDKEKDKPGPSVILLTTVVHVGQEKDKLVTTMRIVTPLGTLLHQGLAFKIDDGKQINAPFLQCLPGGCLTDLIFADDMLQTVKNGKAMLVAYRGPDGKDRTMPVSLKGFVPALDALSKRAKNPSAKE